MNIQTKIWELSFCILLLVFMTFSQAADQYEINWHTIDRGGGTSTGGQYRATGTIAQHDVAYSEGGDYELLGGFWPSEPMCIVDFHHFARFAQYWLDTDPDVPADLYKDAFDIVDELDLMLFTDQWLYYCPYNWQLK